MKHYLLAAFMTMLVTCAITPSFILAQETKTTNKDKKAIEVRIVDNDQKEKTYSYASVQDKPTFQGADASTFSIWVNSRLKYPEKAQKMKATGRITIQFTIEEDGAIKDVKVLRSPAQTADGNTSKEMMAAYKSLEEEAIRVVSSSPNWTPGKQDGKLAKISFVFPIIFQMM